MKETTLKVNGMVCGGCENRVQNALKTIEGIKEVKADHTNNTVKIISNEDISKETMEQKIEDIGFEVIKED